MTIVRRAEAVSHRMHGATFHSYAAPARGSAELCAWRVEIAPGTAGAPHRIGREEVFLQLEGQLTYAVDGVASTLAPGDVLVVPAGAELAVDNSGDGTGAAWVTTSVGFEAVLADGSAISPPWVR